MQLLQCMLSSPSLGLCIFYKYIASQDNLAIPIVCHVVYDVGVLMWAHYAVTSLTQEEQIEILEWNADD